MLTMTTHEPTAHEWLQEVEVEAESRQEELHARRLAGINELLQVFAASMVGIPKKTKSVIARDFDSTYQSDIVALVVGNHERSAMAPVEATPRRRPGAVTAAPTPSRTVRRGEVLYSQNGSPVDTADQGALVATITKKPRAQRASVMLDIHVGEGRTISLDENVGNLDAGTKATALDQVQMLKERLAELEQQLSTRY